MLFINLFIAIVFVGITLVLSVPARRTALAGVASTIGVAAVAITLAVKLLAPEALGCSACLATFNHDIFGSIGVVCDGLSAWFIAIVGFVFVVGAFYGKAYIKHYNAASAKLKLHWTSVIVTLAGMVILFTTNNLIIFLIGWELMAIGSFFAVIFESEKTTVIKAGLNYFVQSHIAVLLITVAFTWAYSLTGDLTFGAFEKFFGAANATQSFVMMMILVSGFGCKAGLIPFHSWLPHAHPAAPSHISAMMSGVIVKAGIYGILRFGSFMTCGQTSCGVAILAIGVLSGLYGIVNAAVHGDFKRMLAYCTIENVGIISMGIGVGFIGLGLSSDGLALLGFAGAMLHTLNHALFKSLLFFAAGNVYVATHTRNMEQLGGLIPKMPRTALLFLLGSIAVGGLPPFGGFISEFVIYGSFLQGFQLDGVALPVVMALAGGSLAVIGGASMMAFTKTFGVIFLGTPRTALPHEPREVGRAMLWPAYILIIPIFIFFAVPALFFEHAATICDSLFAIPIDSVADTYTSFSSLIEHISWATIALVALVALVFFIRTTAMRKRAVHESNTWGCGYAKPIKGIQYTGNSFVGTLADLFRIILPGSSRYRQITTEEIFPQDRGHISANFDFCEHSVIEPSTKGLMRFLDKFQFVQNGYLQRYIVYGLAYVIILIASATIF